MNLLFNLTIVDSFIDLIPSCVQSLLTFFYRYYSVIIFVAFSLTVLFHHASSTIVKHLIINELTNEATNYTRITYRRRVKSIFVARLKYLR